MLLRRFSKIIYSRNLHSTTTVNPNEINKFVQAAEEWWDPQGQFSILHRMNPVRVGYIRRFIEQEFKCEDPSKPFKGLDMLDMGCGGGLLSESLARLGGKTMGVDAGLENIQMAQYHMKQDPGLSSSLLEYQHTTAEHLAEKGSQFDVVCALEIIEHVADKQAFLAACSHLVKPGGLFFISTINQTLLAKLGTIMMAEYVLGLVPKGTHDYEQYVPPETLQSSLLKHDFKVLNMSGLYYNLLNRQWSLGRSLDMNYIMVASKQK